MAIEIEASSRNDGARSRHLEVVSMHLRTVRFAGSPEDLGRAISAFEQVSAPVRRQPGCAAVALLADRQAGKGVVASYWETEEAMNASEEAAASARAKTAAEHGLQVVDVERYEVTLLERRHPLKAGTFARLISAQVAPDQVDHTQREVRERALPIITVQKGFRSVVTAINRKNGKLLAGSTWETAADREASNAPLASIRQQVIGAGSSIEVENYEVAFAEIRVAAGTGS
jgi:heme-degrading monooxygenase HmoA